MKEIEKIERKEEKKKKAKHKFACYLWNTSKHKSCRVFRHRLQLKKTHSKTQKSHAKVAFKDFTQIMTQAKEDDQSVFVFGGKKNERKKWGERMKSVMTCLTVLYDLSLEI